MGHTTRSRLLVTAFSSCLVAAGCSSDSSSANPTSTGGSSTGGSTSSGGTGTAGSGGSGGGSAGTGAAASGGSSTGGAGGSFPAPYTVTAFDRVRINSHGDQENFQNASADIDWGEGPFAKVTLVFDLDTTCQPFDSWLGSGPTNPPPQGENWPADCDAFDRNFEFVLDDPTSDSEPPGLELVRAITPFGGQMTREIDITDVANGLPGAHRLRTHISTWSDSAGQVSGSNGGWWVSARIEAVPGPAPRKVLAVVPLFDGGQTSAGPVDAIDFTAPAGTTTGKVEYRVTGHGSGSGVGCAQPADEFCKRDHRLFVDSVQIGPPVVPWRDDCSELCTIAHYGPIASGLDYCAENPTGSIASVNASRANWCPGDVTPPMLFEQAALGQPGQHSFGWTITDIAPGGSWRISATYFAYGD